MRINPFTSLFAASLILHYNLKPAYKTLKSLKDEPGLKKAVKMEGFEFTGIHHRAISDAENLAKIFIKYFKEWSIG